MPVLYSSKPLARGDLGWELRPSHVVVLNRAVLRDDNDVSLDAGPLYRPF